MYVCGALSTFPSAMLDPEAEPGGCVSDEESSTRNLLANGAHAVAMDHFGGEDGIRRLALSPGGRSSRHNPQPAALTAAAAPHLATRVRDGYEAWLLALADTPIARHEADGHGRDLPRDAALQDAAPIAAVAPSPSVTTDDLLLPRWYLCRSRSTMGGQLIPPHAFTI